MANPFVHVELHTGDVARSKEFYGSLFDWKFESLQMGEMTYTMIQVEDGTGGGMMAKPAEGAPTQWLAYVGVEDARAAAAKAKKLGANIIQEVTEVPDCGWLSVIQDPTGAVLGLWQAKH